MITTNFRGSSEQNFAKSAQELPSHNSPNLKMAWVYPDLLTERLDSATWIETSRELKRLGWDVLLLSKGEKAGTKTIRGVETVNFPAYSGYLVGQLLFHLDIWRYLLGIWEHLDIIFFTQVSAFWLFPLRWYRFFRRRKIPLLIMDTRDLDDPVPGSWKSKLRISFHRMVFWMADFMVDGQTTITERMAEIIQIPSDKLLGIWPSGVRPEEFSSAFTKRNWPDKDQPIHLMYIGILAEHRNPIALCHAVERANAQGMQFKLFLVGNGPALGALKSLIGSENKDIQLIEPVAHDMIPDMLAQAHVGITSLPDPDNVKYQASSPVKLFEYMASGLPILATSSFCHTEVVGDGRFVYWANGATEDAIYGALCDLWEDRDALSTRGREAQNAVHNWTWEAAAEKLHHAFLKGLAQSAESPER